MGHDFTMAGISLTHTYVRVVSENSNTSDFACYGRTYDDDKATYQASSTVSGNYEIPNCYRNTIPNWVDTAGLGVYARHGVCHQAANCFMNQTGITLETDKVHGSGLSYFAYGVYGTNIPTIGNSEGFHKKWLKTIYDPCTTKYTDNNIKKSNTQTSLHTTLHSVYETLSESGISDSHEIISKECSTVLKFISPNFDYGRIEEKHREYLKEHTSIITSNKSRGSELASKINELSFQFQKIMSDLIDSNTYKKIFSVEPGNLCAIIEPNLAELDK